jgi:phospholipid/cholesterol/gamma-HCH transport system ATP-binding protein
MDDRAPQASAANATPGQKNPIISVRGVVNRFGKQVVHDGIDLDIFPGEVVGIVGGSGAGKSVLLHTMLGLHRPSAGQVLLEGKDLTELSGAELTTVKRHYGVTFQHGALFTSLTVAQNIELPIREHFDVSREALTELTRLRLQMVGLSPDSAQKLPSQLSGGMVKRAALARALALDPTLLFLDEPTAGLDPISAAAFDELVKYLHEHLELTVVMITHDLDTLMSLCSRVAVLVDRKLIIDSLEKIVDNPHPWIREYFHGPRARAVQPKSRPKSE